MVARLDVRKSKLYPEELPESIRTVASTSGTSIASYSAYSPYTLFLKSLMTSQTPGGTLRIDNDSGHAVIESPLDARPDREFSEVDIVSHDSLDLWAVGTAFEMMCTFVLRVTKMTVYEKLKYGISLDDEEAALAEEFDTRHKFSAGLLKKAVEVQQFKKIIEVARDVTVAAAGSTRVGRVVNVRRGEKAVLLGISCDSSMVSTKYGGPGPNDTFITLNRDVSDLAHFKLDCVAMPSINRDIPIYVPAINQHEILVESTTGITNLPVRYRYGVADLTIIDKIRWDISLTKDEKAIADGFNLEDSVKAGVV